MKLLILTITLMLKTATYAQGLNLGHEDYIKILKKSHRGLPFHGNILIKQGGKELFRYSQGQAVREWEVEHTNDSKFMIASISKQFTAYAILNLEKEGKLKRTDLIGNYIKLPKNALTNKELWNKITIHHLLSHTSGLIRDVPQTPHMSPSDYNLISSIIFHSLQGKNVTFKETGEFYYSNLAYLFLAQIIEKTSRSKYSTYIKKIILNPLKMYHTGEFHRLKYIPNMATGYYYNDSYKTQKRCCRDATTFTGSHSLYSTIDDLALWQKEVHAPQALDKSIMDQLKSKQVTSDDQEFYGYGVFQTEKGNRTSYWHTGHEYGYVSLLTYIDDLDLTIIYLSNSHGQEGHFGLPNSLKFQNLLLETL